MADYGYVRLCGGTGQSPCVRAWPAAALAKRHPQLWRQCQWRRYAQCGAIWDNLTFYTFVTF